MILPWQLEVRTNGLRLAVEVGAVALLGVAILTMVAVVPASRPALGPEDGLLENAGAALFLLATVLGCIRLRQDWGARPALAVAPAAVLALVAFLDEVGFGSGLIGWTPPPLPGGGELDGLHDLAILVRRGVGIGLAGWPASTGALLSLPVVALVFIVRRWWPASRRLAEVACADPLIARTGIAIALLAGATLLDAELLTLRGLGYLEELAEVAAAVFLVTALAWKRTTVSPRADDRATFGPGPAAGSGPSRPRLPRPPERWPASDARPRA